MNIVQAFNDSREKIVLPLHPRTKSYLAKYQLKFTDNVKVISPVLSEHASVRSQC